NRYDLYVDVTNTTPETVGVKNPIARMAVTRSSSSPL
ncbi:MAG: hypothetical protein ACI82O_002460, partial [Patiriisocius sp.]